MNSGKSESLVSVAQSGVKQLLLRYGIGFIINIAGTVIIARKGGPELWGLFAVSQVVLTVFVVLSQGCWAYVIQSKSSPSAVEIGNCYLLQTIISVVWILIVLGLSSTLSQHITSNDLLPLLLGTVLGGFFYGWRYVIGGLSERNLQYQVVTITELSDIVVFNGVAIILSIAGHPYYGILAGNCLRGILSMLVAMRVSREKVYFRLESSVLMRIARFSVPYSGFAALQWLPIYAGPVFAGIFLGIKELGLLQLAYKTVEYPRVLVTVTSRISMSLFSRLGATTDDLRSGLKHTIDALNYLLIPAMFLIAALGPVWIPFVYGPQWLPMSDIMLIIMFPHLTMSMMMIITTLLSSQGKSQASFIFYCMYNALYWSALVILTPLLQFYGLPITEWVSLAGCVILLTQLRSLGIGMKFVFQYARLLLFATLCAVIVWSVAHHRTHIEAIIVGFMMTISWFLFSPARKEMVKWISR
jgi:PST family polysaccharide transporter